MCIYKLMGKERKKKRLKKLLILNLIKILASIL